MGAGSGARVAAMTAPRRHVASAPPTPTLRRIATGRQETPEPPVTAAGRESLPRQNRRPEGVDRVADVAANAYRADYKRCARIAEDMAEVGAHRLAAEFRQFAYIALTASRAERR